MIGSITPLLSSTFFSATDFLKRYNFQSWRFFPKEIPKTTYPFSLGVHKHFFEIFFAEGSKLQAGMLILRQKYIPFELSHKK
jgi:hypothetical protein